METSVENSTMIHQGGLRTHRMGMGVMTWGDAKGLARLHPAKIAYGSPQGFEEEKQAFDAALAGGVSLFDTAAMYSGGASERRLGELARDRSVWIASKFPDSFSFRAEDFPKELEASLQRLGRSQIDLYQHHYPNRSVSIPALMEHLADAVEAGKIRTIGVSNYSVEQMRLAHAALARRGIPLASNQVEYSLLHRQPETNGLLDACRELDIILIAYQPLASGALAGKYLSGQRPGGLRRFMPSFRPKNLQAVEPVIALLAKTGERYEKSPAQVAIRWLIEKENVIPIPGAKNARQAAANAGALSFHLTAEEVDTLDQATRLWRG